MENRRCIYQIYYMVEISNIWWIYAKRHKCKSWLFLPKRLGWDKPLGFVQYVLKLSTGAREEDLKCEGNFKTISSHVFFGIIEVEK